MAETKEEVRILVRTTGRRTVQPQWETSLPQGWHRTIGNVAVWAGAETMEAFVCRVKTA